MDPETYAGLREFVLEDARGYENGPVIPVSSVLDYWDNAAKQSHAVTEHLKRLYRERGARLMAQSPPAR
ncbi:MAG: hypothetical protein ACRDTE_20180, partial [Pseudonocardiaceae bacterium]